MLTWKTDGNLILEGTFLLKKSQCSTVASRENDFEFSGQDAAVSEISIKAGSTVTIEIPAEEVLH